MRGGRLVAASVRLVGSSIGGCPGARLQHVGALCRAAVTGPADMPLPPHLTRSAAPPACLPCLAGPCQPARPVAGYHPAGCCGQRPHGAARAVDAGLDLAHRLPLGRLLLRLGADAQVRRRRWGGGSAGRPAVRHRLGGAGGCGGRAGGAGGTARPMAVCPHLLRPVVAACSSGARRQPDSAS